jgi:hypothetical protein
MLSSSRKDIFWGANFDPDAFDFRLIDKLLVKLSSVANHPEKSIRCKTIAASTSPQPLASCFFYSHRESSSVWSHQ